MSWERYQCKKGGRILQVPRGRRWDDSPFIVFEEIDTGKYITAKRLENLWGWEINYKGVGYIMKEDKFGDHFIYKPPKKFEKLQANVRLETIE